MSLVTLPNTRLFFSGLILTGSHKMQGRLPFGILSSTTAYSAYPQWWLLDGARSRFSFISFRSPSSADNFFRYFENLLTFPSVWCEIISNRKHSRAIVETWKRHRCHNSATPSVLKDALQSKTAHHTATCNALFLLLKYGAPETIRTSDHCLRRAVLYPTELRALVRLQGPQA